MLGPSDDVAMQSEPLLYDTHTPPEGVLNDPSGFGTRPFRPEQKKRPGIIGSEDEEEMKEKQKVENGSKGPTVKGALADLHHAVSDKIQSWNPYFVKGAHSKNTGSGNWTTSGATSKNKTTGLLGGESVRDGVPEDERLGARTRIGKATVLFSGNSFWERCIRTHEAHDRVHGYRLHVLRQLLMDDVWSKPAYILSLLLREMSKPESERLEWLFWVDADTIILNPYIPIETFLPPPGTEFEDVWLMYSNDWNGLNNGVFPIRVNQWAVELFAAIVSYRHFRPKDGLVFRDQSAMNTLMQEPAFAKHIMQAPQRWFNAYQGEHNETLQPFQVRRGDLLVHFAGVPERESRMQYWLERAEQHLDDWEVPVKSTSYPQEAKDFWNEQREIRKNMNLELEETRKKAEQLLWMTDQNLNDYGDRLEEDARVKIGIQRDDLKMVVEQEPMKSNLEKIQETVKGLEEISHPLSAVIAEANKALLKSAHDAIFAAEKDLLDGNYGQGVSDPELEKISGLVQNLKAQVMAPQETWNRNNLKSGIQDVVEARARWAERVVEKEKARVDSVLVDVPADGEVGGGVGTGGKGVANAEGGAGAEGAEPAPEVKYGAVVTAAPVTVWETQVVTSTSADVAAATPEDAA